MRAVRDVGVENDRTTRTVTCLFVAGNVHEAAVALATDGKLPWVHTQMGHVVAQRDAVTACSTELL